MNSEKKNGEKALDPKTVEAVKDIWDSLSDEQKEKAKACKDEKELFALLKGDGAALSDESLDEVSGGAYYVYDENKKCYNIYLKDNYLIETQTDKNFAICVTDFYTYLEDTGYFD